jgi:hypothetical protein
MASNFAIANQAAALPLPRGLSGKPIPLGKTRVGGFCRRRSGRLRARRPQVADPASGCRACAYETASGRGFWPNRDPLGEKGGVNLYGFVRNEAFTNVDFLGLALTPYTEDPTTIPVRESSRILARADGEAGIEWPPSVARVVGKKVHVEGKLVLRPTYQPGVDPNAWSGVDIFRQTVAEHERYHGLIAKSSWNGNLKIVDFWEGEYCTAACAALAGDLADAWNRYGYWQDKIRQAEYDISSYGDLSEQPRARKQIAIGGANREMDVIRDRRDRFFNVLRCVKN